MLQRIRGLAEDALVAMVAVAVAAILRLMVSRIFHESIPYTLFYPAIIIATMYGRLPGGVIASVLAAFAAAFWLTPLGKPLIQEPTDLMHMFFFLAVSGLVVGLCEAMLRAKQSAESALEDQRRAVEREHHARLEAEEANRLKDEFLASASHELRTPLQAILGWAHLLGQNDISEQDHALGLDVIERNALVQSRLIEDMLDLSRIVAGKMRLSPRCINPHHVVDAAIQTVAIAAQAKQIAIVRSADGDNLEAWADPDRLQQVVWNLLSNSIKFSPPESTIRVELRRKADCLEIEVADQGAGIDSELLPHIFERFRQADKAGRSRQEGLGLGLSIVKHLVELHGGTVRAFSAGRGHGLAITVTLPRVDGLLPLRADDKTRLVGGPAELRGIRALVVEDDAITCELIARILRERHCQVLAVTSVERALEEFEGFEPDVIVSDISMPEQDGYELLRQVRKRLSARRRIPAVALTALSSSDDRRRAFEAGYRFHLTKPVDSRVLTDAVAQVTLH